MAQNSFQSSTNCGTIEDSCQDNAALSTSKTSVVEHSNSAFEVVDKDEVDPLEEDEAEQKSIKDTLTKLYNQWTRQQTDDDSILPPDSNGDDDDEEDGDSQWMYYNSKMTHDIEWSSTDNLFLISPDLFDRTESSEFVEEMNSYQLLQNTHSLYKNNTKIKRKRKWFTANGSTKKKEREKDKDIDKNEVVDKEEEMTEQKVSWSESINSMLTQAKHKVYSMIGNQFSIRSNRHLFCLNADVIILGQLHPLNGDNVEQNIQSIVLDIYSKIWLTYRSQFPPLLRTSYTSDAGWGCMLRTAQMMTANALAVYHFDYHWTLPDLHQNNDHLTTYFHLLEQFNDAEKRPFSIHSMLRHGAVLYKKPVGHWFGPNESCFMIKGCIESNAWWRDRIQCLVSDSGTIYKSDLSTDRHLLIFLPLRFGLEALNTKYIASIKKCFELKQCIGIIGGKPQRSLYFIGHQEDRLFYLDPHTVFPAPNNERPLDRQKCVFHCQEINSLDAKLLDPSMAIGFFIKPTQIDLEEFWKSATELMHSPFPVFNLALERPNYDQFDEDNVNDSSSNLGNEEWEKI